MHHPFPLSRLGSGKRAAALLAATALAALALPAVGQASSISNVGEYTPNGVFDTFGPANAATATYGQTITVPAGQTRLHSFTFYLSEPTSVDFRAYVYKWNGEEATGPTLFESAPMHTTEYTEGQFQAITVNSDNLIVSPGEQYVLFFSTSRDAAEDEGNGEAGGWAFVENSNLGHIAYLNAGYAPNEEWTSRQWEGYPNWSFEFSAVFNPAPAVSSVSPSEYASAGTQVTISGENFTGATEVLFGSVPATSFTVNNDGSITAVAPAGVSGTVDVKVVGPEGESAISSGDEIGFGTRPSTGTSTSPSTTTTTSIPLALAPRCVVPKMRSMSLTAVKAALTAAHCGLGSIEHHYNALAKGELTEQDRHQGTILAAGTKVDVWLSMGHRPHKHSR
jgi:IPT/TIG domain